MILNFRQSLSCEFLELRVAAILRCVMSRVHLFKSWIRNHRPVVGPPVSPHVAAPVSVNFATQATDAASIIAIAFAEKPPIPEGR
jgi:hypothetical protein